MIIIYNSGEVVVDWQDLSLDETFVEWGCQTFDDRGQDDDALLLLLNKPIHTFMAQWVERHFSSYDFQIKRKRRVAHVEAQGYLRELLEKLHHLFVHMGHFISQFESALNLVHNPTQSLAWKHSRKDTLIRALIAFPKHVHNWSL